jgi:hypothetical protein
MERPEKIAGHDVSDDAQQHQKNRHPENPTVVHSPPARSVRMTVVMLVIMVLIVHTKERKHITGTGVLGKEKGPSRTGGSCRTGVSEADRRLYHSTEINVSLSS